MTSLTWTTDPLPGSRTRGLARPGSCPPWDADPCRTKGMRFAGCSRCFPVPTSTGTGSPWSAGRGSPARQPCWVGLLIHRMLTVPGARVFFTAQSGQRAGELWLDLVGLVLRSELARKFHVIKSVGHQKLIYEPNDSVLAPFAPQPDALHGAVSDLVVLDECWSFTEERGRELMAAVMPTQVTRPGAQVVLTSTAGTPESTWFRRFVDLGRAGEFPGYYLEHSIERHPDWDADAVDVDLVLSSHPALNRTVTKESLLVGLAAMGETEWCRAIGNAWARRIQDRVISADAWARTLEIPERPGAGFVIGVDADPGGVGAALSAGVRLRDGRVYVELPDAAPGSEWTVGALRGPFKAAGPRLPAGRHPRLRYRPDSGGPAHR